MGANPVDGVNFAYLGPTITFTVANATQSVFVSGEVTLGSTVRPSIVLAPRRLDHERVRGVAGQAEPVERIDDEQEAHARTVADAVAHGRRQRRPPPTAGRG